MKNIFSQIEKLIQTNTKNYMIVNIVVNDNVVVNNYFDDIEYINSNDTVTVFHQNEVKFSIVSPPKNVTSFVKGGVFIINIIY